MSPLARRLPSSRVPRAASPGPEATGPPVVSVLQIEPCLARHIDPADLPAAEAACRVPALRWTGPPSVPWVPLSTVCGPEHLLVDGGHCLLRTTLDGHLRSVELVGPGDVFSCDDRACPDVTVELRVLTQMSVGVVDADFWQRCAPWPSVAHGITALALRRSAEMARSLALMHVPNLTLRLHALLWRLAERFGNVTRSGVRLPVVLRQENLADLAGARRQSVNAALRTLKDDGQVDEDDHGRLTIQAPRGAFALA